MPSMNDDADHDRIFKIQTLLDFLLPKYQQLPQLQVLCIGKQIVSFKGHSAIKQYLPQKPHKSGYKLLVLHNTNGIIHIFEYLDIANERGS